LNPFNGIRFTASGDTEDLLKFVRDSIMVLSNTKDGKEVQADGHFFLQSSEIVAFMPDKTEPGIVFTVKNRQDPDWITRFAAFPELNSRINFSSETVELIIFWKQLENYLPNPAGQVIRLNNSLIQIKTADETILTLDVEKAPPYGNFGAVSYRSRPYEMTFTIDRSGFDFENLLPLELSVQASVDGQKERVEVFNRRFHKESEELPDSPSATSEVKNIPPSSSVIQELSDLPEDVELLNIHRFTIVKSDSQRFRAWPEEVAWSEDGTMWVVDSQRRKLMNFDAEGNLKFAFGEKGKKPGSMSLPVALVVQKGRIFVSDRTAVAIHKFSEDGTFLKTITTSQKSSFVLGQPGTLCIRGTELWVADRTKNRIHCFDIEGKHLGGFGIEVDAHINSPVGVRADSEGLWVLESNGIIKKFTPMGQQTGAFQTGCSEPRGFDVDPWGGIWVCDAAKNQVIRFNASGRLLNLISAPPGPKPWVPTGVAVRKDGMIAVTDAENKQIHIFAAEK
jgi:DNA-binding beta-propeller fold protein YncE